MATETRLIALDWGTTTLRAYRLGGRGALLEERQFPCGVMRLDGSAAVERTFGEACGDWLAAAPGAPVIACGMVGSALGWREIGYLDVPVGLDGLAGALVEVASSSGQVVHLVPGLLVRGELPGVMRGEETQLVGALDDPPAEEGPVLVGLPGTHGKWVQVAGRRAVHFDTFMTGEVYAALTEHTILARTLRPPERPDLAAFDRGVAVARSLEGRAGLLATAFSVRSLGLAGALPAEQQPDYLSGLLVGHELRGLEELHPGLLEGTARLVLAGSAALCERYRRALAAFGRPDARVAEHATERGLWRIAVGAGLVVGEASAPAAAVQAGPRGVTVARALRACGLVAILRGIRPDEAAAVGRALHAAGLRAIEVPLKSPEPYESIRRLREALPEDCLVGAGTVLTPAQAAAARAAGAAALKLFPGEALGPAVLKAWRADHQDDDVPRPAALAVPEGGDGRGAGGVGRAGAGGPGAERGRRRRRALRLPGGQGPAADRGPLDGAVPGRLLPGRRHPHERAGRHRPGALGHQGQGGGAAGPPAPGRPAARPDPRLLLDRRRSPGRHRRRRPRRGRARLHGGEDERHRGAAVRRLPRAGGRGPWSGPARPATSAGPAPWPRSWRCSTSTPCGSTRPIPGRRAATGSCSARATRSWRRTRRWPSSGS